MQPGDGLRSRPAHPAGSDVRVVEAVLQALQRHDPSTPACHSIELIETHFAWVFLTAAYAYKLKKAVYLPDLDLRDIAARKRSCAEELRLNRRLAPDVYLEAMPLVQGTHDGFQFGGEGTVIDWLVKMRRLPAELMLDRAIRTGCAATDRLTEVGELLADFYVRQPPVPMSARGFRQRLAGQIVRNRLELTMPDLKLRVSDLNWLMRMQEYLLEYLGPEFDSRATSGRIVECHGDLRPEHICLSRPPCIIDSLEFARDLRILDPCEELAYLSVECSLLGAAPVAQQLLETYRRRTNDIVSGRLFGFYRSHRATTRAKIVAWHVRDPTCRDREPWLERASKYVALAIEALECATDQ